MANKGYIKLHRKIQECWVWDADEKYSKGQAWVDLLLLANHKEKKMAFDNKIIVIDRGQLVTSIDALSRRWHWAFNTTKRFLRLLESDGMLTRKSDNRKTLITIENYEIYQGRDDEDDEDADRQTDRLLDSQADRLLDGLTANKLTDSLTPNKNVKNVKNEKNEKNVKNNIYSPKSREIIALYNSICKSFPKARETEKRIKTLNTRLKKYTADDFALVFTMAEESDFLSGRSGVWTSCSFDWLINETNMIKVLEGNYKNKSSTSDIDNWLNGSGDDINIIDGLYDVKEG